jgi:transposase
LVNDKIRLTNRLTNTLKQYYPQALDWFEQRDTALFCDFLTRWPTLLQVKRARQASIQAFFHAHNGRRPQVIAGRLEAIKAAVPLTQDAGVIVPCKLHAAVLVEQLRVTLRSIDQFDREIAQLAPTLPDYSLFQGLPGAGPHLTPRLLVAFGEDRQRFQRADELQKYAGIAPVTERSGKKSWVHWRWQCPTFLRQTFVEGIRITNHSGLVPTIGSNAKRAALTRRPYVRWRSSGCGSSTAAGKRGRPTMKPNTSTH